MHQLRLRRRFLERELRLLDRGFSKLSQLVVICLGRDTCLFTKRFDAQAAVLAFPHHCTPLAQSDLLSHLRDLAHVILISN